MSSVPRTGSGLASKFSGGKLFWVGVAAAVVAFGAAYALVDRKLSAELAVAKRELEGTLGQLRILSEKPSIPNETIIQQAKDQTAELRTTYGQLMVLYATRSAYLDEPFEAVRGKERIGPTEGILWWTEYKRKTDALLEAAQTQLDAPEDVFVFEKDPGVPVPMERLKRLQADFQVLKTVFETLAAANPKQDPLIKSLRAIRRGSDAARLQHGWVQSIPFTVQAEMRFERLPLLLAALENSPRPIMVSEYAAAQPGGLSAAPAGRAAPGAASGFTPKFQPETPFVDVLLKCELVAFKPAIQKTAFAGSLFKDSASVKAWLMAQRGDMNAVFSAMIQEVPGLASRVEMELGQSVQDVRHASEEAFQRIDKKLAEEGPGELKKKLDAEAAAARAARKTFGPREEAAVRAAHEAAMAEQKNTARLQVPALADKFFLAYDQFYALNPEKPISTAYFMGGRGPVPGLVIARAPEGSAPGSGRWWLGDHRQPSAVAGAVERIPGIVAVDSATMKEATVALVLSGGAATQILVKDPGGTWRSCPVLKSAEGRALSLSDAAFRLGPAIAEIARNTAKLQPGEGGLRIELFDPKLLGGGKPTEVTVTITQGENQTGTWTMTVGLRK